MGLPAFCKGVSAGCSACAAATQATENTIKSRILPDCISPEMYEKLQSRYYSPVTLLEKPSSSCQIPVTISGRTHPFTQTRPLFYLWGRLSACGGLSGRLAALSRRGVDQLANGRLHA